MKAFTFYKMSADQNDAFGLCRLGDCSYNGIGTKQNYELAFKYYQKSAHMNYAEA